MTSAPEQLFETRRELPDDDLQRRAARLVGFQKRFDRLQGQVRLLIDVEGLRKWANKHHEGAPGLLAALSDRYPLLIFHGDVGTGKTATAEASADALARLLDVDGRLLKLSTRVRGIGHVGEMSTLISDAFAEALALAGKERFVALVVDEGDALAFNRGAERAHHEDRVGVNTLIQKIDDARDLRGRLLVIVCTNRYAAIDPAIVRRASLIEEFLRPDDDERRQVLTMDLQGVSVDPGIIDELVTMTGQRDSGVGFTFSDITTRLLPAAVARAFPSRPLTAQDLLVAAAEMKPTPVMGNGEG